MFDTLAIILELMVLFAIIVIANIITGTYNNVNVKNLKFDWSKLLNGLIKAVVIGFGTILGTIPIAMLPHLVNDLGIQIEYINEISVAIVFSIIAGGIFYYSKSFIKNLKNIYKGGQENVEK